MKSRGQPKRFANGQQMIDLWQNFCESIVENGYKDVPTQTNFVKWLSGNYEKTTRRTIYNSLNEYFPDIKKEFKQIQSDVIVQGVACGKWQPAIMIFALKNWCKWTDKPSMDTEQEMLNKLDSVLDKIMGD